jgi:two-component system cell cycle response regulator
MSLRGTLPAETAPAAGTLPRRLTATGEHGAVLVATDNAVLRRQISQPLRQHGFEVVEVNDADEAVRLARDFDIDVAVVDVNPPGPGGPEVLQRWREEGSGRYVPVVLLTGRTALDDVGVSIHLGAHDYLLPPVEAIDVLARVHSALAAKRRHDEFGRRVTELLELVLTDPLTGLYNRRHMETELAALASAARRQQTPLGVLLIDVDHFKRINDRHGHDAGDAALRAVAHRLRSFVRAEDVVGRWGGDEFVVLLPSTDRDAALILGRRLCHEMARSINGDAGAVPGTVSVGCSASSDPVESDLIASADAALRRAKARGRNRASL